MSFGVPSPRTSMCSSSSSTSLICAVTTMHGILPPDTLHRPHAGEAAGSGGLQTLVAGIAADRSHSLCTAYVKLKNEK